MKNATHNWSLLDRLMHYVSIQDGGCWLWTGGTNKAGYGRISVSGRLVVAHRVSYELHVGEVPDQLCVLHRCDVPSCVNPEHLFLGTHTDNMRDMVSKGRNVARRGEENSQAKLTKSRVLLLREKYASGSSNISALAREFGVSRRAIRFAIKGETWAT